MESGEQTPSPAAVVRLAEVLGVTPGDLVDVDIDQATLGQLRHLVGLTQADVAQALGMSPSAYGLAEQGRRRFPPALFDELAEVLDQPTERIRAAVPNPHRVSG